MSQVANTHNKSEIWTRVIVESGTYPTFEPRFVLFETLSRCSTDILLSALNYSIERKNIWSQKDWITIGKGAKNCGAATFHLHVNTYINITQCFKKKFGVTIPKMKDST